MKNILHITRSHSKGPGVYTYTIHQELLKKGYNSTVLTLNEPNNLDKSIISIKKKKRKFLNKFKTLLKIITLYVNQPQINWNFYPYSLNDQKLNFNEENLLQFIDFNPDVILFYFLDNFLNAKNIHFLYRITNAKLFWVIPDMAAITGGCHYSWSCNGYKNSCGNCPAIFSSNKNDITNSNLLFKLNYFKDTPIHIIAPSQQLYKQVKQSKIFKNNSITKILLPINSELYKPIDKKKIREKFGIPDKKKIVFIGAQGLNQKRKGMKILFESFKILHSKFNCSLSDLFIVIAGKNIASIKQLIYFDYKYVGYLDNLTELPEILGAADFYISPSIEDSGPMMINQSIMSGVPVVAFDIGVATDLIIPGETGYIAKKGDSEDLAEKINKMANLSKSEIDRMSKNCRETALTKTSTEVVINQLIKLFK